MVPRGVSLNEGRGFHPRDPLRSGESAMVDDGGGSALNEGRGFHPAILLPTADVRDRRRGQSTRSMKAGAFTPAIPARPVQHVPRSAQSGRSMKAGAFTPAILPDLDSALQDRRRRNAQ